VGAGHCPREATAATKRHIPTPFLMMHQMPDWLKPYRLGCELAVARN
jgi:hypothetical protein